MSFFADLNTYIDKAIYEKLFNGVLTIKESDGLLLTKVNKNIKVFEKGGIL